jgi:hypothetical protein
VLKAFPGLDDTTLNGPVTDTGFGDTSLSDLLGSDTTVNQYLIDILPALVQA